jgi:hypothetical protein
LIQEWNKVRTDWLTIREAEPEPVGDPLLTFSEKVDL